MIILDSSTALEVVQSGASATNASPTVASFHNIIAAGDAMGVQTSTTNGTTPVTIVTAPSSSNSIAVKSIHLHNADTAAITVTIRTNNGGTTMVVFKAALAVGETLQYEDGSGWSKITTACAVAVGTPFGYRLIGPPLYLTTQFSGTTTLQLNIPINCDAFDVELLGGGSGGGGTSSGSGISCNAGGCSGGYVRAFVLTVAGQQYVTLKLGNGGAGGTSGNGSTGTATQATYNGVTYTTGTLSGGKGGARTTAPAVLAGGAASGAASGGDLNVSPRPGQYGIALTSTVGVGGNGGSSVFGGGGASAKTQAAGQAGVLGGGGAGSFSTSLSEGGGSGSVNGTIPMTMICIRFYAKV